MKKGKNRLHRKSPDLMTREELLDYVKDLRKRIHKLSSSNPETLKIISQLTTELNLYKSIYNDAKEAIDPEHGSTHYSMNDVSKMAYHLECISVIRKRIIRKRLKYGQEVDPENNLALNALLFLKADRKDLW